MKKTLSFILIAMLVLSLFGCGMDLPEETTGKTTAETTVGTVAQTTAAVTEIVTTDAETTAEVTEAPIPVDVLDIPTLDMLFLSGAGAWDTEFTLNGDGTFSGVFSDMNMGIVGEGFPNGTRYISSFKGKFGNFQKLNDYTYSMELEYINTELEVDTEWIEDGVKYIASEPYGFDSGKEFKLYTPDAPKTALPEEVAFWLRIRNGELGDIIGFFALENVTEGYGMFEVPAATNVEAEFAALTEQLIVGAMTEEWLKDGYAFTDLDAFHFICSLIMYRDSATHPFKDAVTLSEDEAFFCIDKTYALKLIGDVFGITDFETSDYHTTMYHAESDTYRTPNGIGLWSSAYSYEELEISADGENTYVRFDLVNSELYEYEEANFGSYTFVFDGYKLIDIK